MPVVSISFPENLLALIDDAVERYGYTGRSELVREAVRGLLQELRAGEREPSTPAYVVLVVVLSPKTGPADQRVLDIVHRYREHVKAFYHEFLEDELCLNVIIVRALLEIVRQMISALRRVKGVKRLWTMILDDIENDVAKV